MSSIEKVCTDQILEMRRALNILLEPGQVTELRILGCQTNQYTRPHTRAGYFEYSARDKIIQSIQSIKSSKIIGIVINPLNPEILARSKNRLKYVDKSFSLCSSKNVLKRRWLFIDCDPSRCSGISASNDEHDTAIDRAKEIRAHLRQQGWPDPILADSGNGAHLLYRISISTQFEKLIRGVLESLAFRFDDKRVTIDQAVFDANRMLKLYGTYAKKGDNVPERPHRMSRILECPKTMETVPRKYLEKLARLSPGKEKKTVKKESGPSKSVDSVIKEQGLQVARVSDWQGGTRWILDVCPFNPDHKDRSAFILQFQNGAVFAGCQHQSCPGSRSSGNHWAQLRGPIQKDKPKKAQRIEKEKQDRPGIEITTNLYENIDSAERVLLENKDCEIYQRASTLVRVVRPDSKEASTAPYIEPIPEASLLDDLSKVAYWYRVKADGDEKASLPPQNVIKSLQTRSQWRFPVLLGITEVPILRPDGSLLQESGYDPRTALLFEPQCDFPKLAEAPDRDQALKAVRSLSKPFTEFPFREECDRSAALAAVLTVLARTGFNAASPMFAISAPERGSGKSLLADVIANITTGHDAPRIDQAKSEEENKRILALLMGGHRLVLIDNVEKGLGSAALASVLTATTYQGRLLGSSRMITVPANAVWMATGCNLQVDGDLGRRVIPIELDPKVERPEERKGFKYPGAKLLNWVRQFRGKLVMAGLTILRSYLVADRPLAQKLSAFGSFEEWSALIREALLWLDCPDPIDGRKRIRFDCDPVLESFRRLLQCWIGRFEDRPISVSELIRVSETELVLRDALQDFAAVQGHERYDSAKLGYLFRRWNNRICSGLRFQKTGRGSHGRLWQVEKVNQASVDSADQIESLLQNVDSVDQKQSELKSADSVDEIGPKRRNVDSVDQIGPNNVFPSVDGVDDDDVLPSSGSFSPNRGGKNYLSSRNDHRHRHIDTQQSVKEEMLKDPVFLEDWNERAAILEFEQDMERDAAEALAFDQTLAQRFANREGNSHAS